MKRRVFLGAVASAGAWALAARAQQRAKPHRIGLLRYPSAQHDDLAAFHQGLRESGYEVGRDLLIEERYADGRPERLPALAAELAQLNLALLVVDGTYTAIAARRVFGATPIVFVLAADPVLDGLANSLARPGGNLTGLTFLTVELSAKRLQLLKDAIPKVASVAVLYNPRLTYAPTMLREVRLAGRSLALNINEIAAEHPDGLAPAIGAAARMDALLTLTDGMFFAHRERIVELCLMHRLPALHPEREYVHSGGFMSYGPNHPEMWRVAASYVHQILAGAKAGDLPIRRPAKFELVINLKAAKTLGLEFPQAILVGADQVVN